MIVVGCFRMHLAWRSSLATLVAACALAPGAAQATSTRSGADSLSPRVAELAKPSFRSASQAEQTELLSLPSSGPGSLLRDGNRVLVNVRFERGAANSVGALRTAGAEIIDASQRYQTVTVAARPTELPALGRVAGVAGVTEVLTPILRAAKCPSGAVVSEGDNQLNAASARAGFGVDGSGVTVGILSDSFNRDPSAVTDEAGDVASGDLPGPGNPCGSTTPVGILDDSRVEGEDEGRAMAQIIHDLAPGAAIDFATDFSGELGFAENIRKLAKAGAKVIADDVAYFEEPFFQDGPVAVAVNEVTAGGVSYFSAAGNDNLIEEGGAENEFASWEAPEFRDAATETPTASCPAVLPAYATQCMDFNSSPSTADTGFGITVAKKATLTVDLQWAQPWNGVTTDLDAYLISGGTVLAPSAGKEVHNVASLQRPVEILSWTNTSSSPKTVQLAISRCDHVCDPAEGGDDESPRLKFALLENGGGVTATEYPTSSDGDTVGPTIFGHSGAASAISVGAVPYNDSAKPEYYSSRGPVTHYFGPVSGTSSAPKLASPETVAKPDLVATDGGANTFFGIPESGIWRFYGTSAAAPHAAAVAALVRQANPGASAAQVRAALTSTARPVGSFATDAIGAGLIDAYSAVDSLATAPTITITQPPQALSRNRRPTIQFTANRPVAFACSVDGSAPQPCASPYTVPASLSDGRHGFAVTGTDLGGRAGSSGVASFTIDTMAPRTKIVKHPPRLIRTHHRRARVVFRFRSSETGSTFVCKVDRDLLRTCGKRFALRLEAGRHTVRVRARDQAGNVDATPAIFHFRVKRVG